MGAYFSIDVSELKMFAHYEWLDFGEPCDHECKHSNTAVIGWGPTVTTYELEECRDCWCRAWQDGRWTQERQRHTGMEPFWLAQMEWRQVNRPSHRDRTDEHGETDQSGPDVSRARSGVLSPPVGPESSAASA